MWCGAANHLVKDQHFRKPPRGFCAHLFNFRHRNLLNEIGQCLYFRVQFKVFLIIPRFHEALTDQIAFTATDENKLFFFYGKDNGLANQCHVFRDVPAMKIYETLNAFVRFDLKWLLMVTSPESKSGQFDTSGIKTPGNQFSFFCDANTFPKTPGEGPAPE